MWETNSQSLGSWHALNSLLFLRFASLSGGWVGWKWDGRLDLPPFYSKQLFQRNSTAVSESVQSCLLALPVLFSTQIAFLLLGWALRREKRSPWNRCSSVAESVKPSGIRGNLSSPHQHKLIVQHLPMSRAGKGSAFAHRTAAELTPASKAPSWCRWPSASSVGWGTLGMARRGMLKSLGWDHLQGWGLWRREEPQQLPHLELSNSPSALTRHFTPSRGKWLSLSSCCRNYPFRVTLRCQWVCCLPLPAPNA